MEHLYLFQLRKAVVDHVSDSFLETNVPLLVLIEAAKAGDEKGVEEYAQVFADHANKLVEVNVCSLDVMRFQNCQISGDIQGSLLRHQFVCQF